MIHVRPGISVVITNYNNLTLLRACLSSVLTSQLKNYEIIVVDNASPEPGVAGIVAEFPTARLLQLEKNMGFAAGTNYGIDAATGEFVFLLNNDAILVGDWSQVEKIFSADAQLGALQPKILMADAPVVNNCGLDVNFLGFSWDNHYRLSETDEITEERLAAFSGAAVLLRRAALETIGGFDERYFMYHEDVDLSCRLRLGGWTIQSAPQFIVRHHYSYKRTAQRYYYLERNRLRTVIKNFPLGYLLATLPAALFMELGIIFYSLANHWFLQKIRSYGAVLQSLPYLIVHRLRHRRQIAVRQFVQPFVSRVTFDEVQHPLLVMIANPILWLYRRLLRLVFDW